MQWVSSLFPPDQSVSLKYPRPPSPAVWDAWTAEQRLKDLDLRVRPVLHLELCQRGFSPGSRVLLRAFKNERQLELWLSSTQAGQSDWHLWRRYPIAAASGTLGPKLREGDRQVPEGIYAITPSLLHPASRYHLAMNIGYPNEQDRQLQRTGSFIMIHGGQVSVGCLAMTDPVIEEIYLLVSEALAKGQPEVPVQIFPFRLNEEALAQAVDHPWYDFWRDQLLPIWRDFDAKD
jgi:murein L,D-transpeptidase YafK